MRLSSFALKKTSSTIVNTRLNWIHPQSVHGAQTVCDLADGRKTIIFGGEGYMLDDTGEGPSPCVYILDVDTLVWTRSITHAPAEEHNPGARSLHVTTVSHHGRYPISLRSFPY